MNADIVLVGAGIAGLRCGIELLRKRPSLRIVMLEKYNYTGGRVVSYKKTIEDIKGRCSHVQWENGAGRIHSDHRKVLDLLQTYNLTTLPLDDTMYFEDGGVLSKNIFTDSMRLLSEAIVQLSPKQLATQTLRQILTSVLGESTADSFLLQFPYRAEVDTLRADLGLESFREEMGTYKGYFVVKEGLSALIEGMRAEFERRGGTLFHGQDVKNITKQGSLLFVETQTDAGPVVWEAPTVICALHRDACAELPVFKNWSVLSHLQMEPLVRTYAVFPTSKGTSWFTGLPKIASASPLRFFIPMDPTCGSCMLSYTDGKDARQVLRMLDKYGEEKTGDLLVAQARRSFPDRTIPNPLFFKAHPWTSGCTYWLPGDYDPATLSKEALKPFPDWNLFCCGESFSLRQAWMEGALEHADLLLETYF
jgi:hypothetical protein